MIAQYFERFRDIDTSFMNKQGKGWVIIPIFILLKCIDNNIRTLSGAIEFAVKQNGDTDTNAAIIGGLYGKWFGSQILNEPTILENIQIIKSCDYGESYKPADRYRVLNHPIYIF